MAFKGTKNRTQKQLEVEIENMGGHLNAYTSREQTVYYAKVFKNDVPRAMEILSDILQNSLLDEAAINRERDVILREMEEVNKQYEEVILDHLHETAFLDTGLGRTILGPEENIRSLTKNDLESYIKTHYTSDRFVVAGAGAVDHKQLVELTEKHFGKLPLTPPSGISLKMEPAIFTGSDKRIRYDSMKVYF
jgi:processing peptidase subunit beta